MDIILVSVVAAIAIAQVIKNAHYAIFKLTGYGRSVLVLMMTAVAITQFTLPNLAANDWLAGLVRSALSIVVVALIAFIFRSQADQLRSLDTIANLHVSGVRSENARKYPNVIPVVIYAMVPMAFGGLHWAIAGGVGLCAFVPIFVVQFGTRAHPQ